MQFGVRFTGNDWGNELTGGARADTLNGLAGNDILRGWEGNDVLNGGPGTDTAVYAGARSAYQVQRSGSDVSVRALSGSDGTDTLNSVERLRFQGISLALDTQPGQAAGNAALVVRALLGPEFLRDATKMGDVLAFVDGGLALNDVVGRVLAGTDFTKLAGSRSNTDFVRFVYDNVVGFAPGPADLSYFVGLLDRGQFTQVSLGMLAATVDINATSVEIVGLAQSGVEYVAHV
jgi:hypothetical protein